ncbi:MAG: phenylacetate-CoA oxygenase, PaaI subunit [Crocinitomicaceae bacterium]|jgi:ring-1,2-phenylacetyl-CoA epoxidase subunit PaaC|nr:phenylacetate-CoA oxygenase, PaaI subunit [Crocinitomicaceae bacterium]
MEAKIKYYLQIADNALIMSHRLNKYGGKALFLDQDPINTNIALELTSLAETIYRYLAEKGEVDTRGTGSNYFVYYRAENEFCNCIVAEQENENFTQLMLKRFLIDNFNYYFFMELSRSSDRFLAMIAGKFFLQVTGHLSNSSRWMNSACNDENMRLEVQKALPSVWRYTPELFTWSDADIEMFRLGIGADLDKVRGLWMKKVSSSCFSTAVQLPPLDPTIFFGKEGFHSDHLSKALNAMQYLTHPDSVMSHCFKQIILN